MMLLATLIKTSHLKGVQAKDLGSGNFNTLLNLKELLTHFRTLVLIWLSECHHFSSFIMLYLWKTSS